MKKFTLSVIFSALFLLIGCGQAPAPSSKLASAINQESLCSLFNPNELNQLYGATDIVTKKNYLSDSPINQCEFTSPGTQKSVNAILKIDATIANSKKGFDDSKTYWQSNTDQKPSPIIDYTDLGTAGFGVNIATMSIVITYQNNQFLAVASRNFGSPEQNQTIAKSMAQKILEKIK